MNPEQKYEHGLIVMPGRMNGPRRRVTGWPKPSSRPRDALVPGAKTRGTEMARHPWR
jgi:hypothetical protein